MNGDDDAGRTWLPMGLALAVLWLFIRGISWIDHPVTLVEEAIIGLLVGMPIAYATRRMYADRVPFGSPVRSPLYAVMYVAYFVEELVTANVDVTYRVLHPSMPIYPDVIEMPLRVESDLAITTIANSITLTPGTLTMDYDDDRNALYIHAIDARDPESVIEPIRRWEDFALVIFDERRSPDDPVFDLTRGPSTEDTGDLDGGSSGGGDPDGE